DPDVAGDHPPDRDRTVARRRTAPVMEPNLNTTRLATTICLSYPTPTSATQRTHIMLRRIPHPVVVLLISCAGFLPIVALLMIAGDQAGAALEQPQTTFQFVHPPTIWIRAWSVAGNLGDALGYYLIVLPIAARLQRVAPTTWGRRGARLLAAYGFNGACWALFAAVVLPIVMGCTAEDWANASALYQTFGWGVIGNTLGGTAWLLLGWSWRRQRPAFAVCSALLGGMYMLGGTIAHLVVSSTVSLTAITFYLFVQLLIWNPWAAHVGRAGAQNAPASTANRLSGSIVHGDLVDA